MCLYTGSSERADALASVKVLRWYERLRSILNAACAHGLFTCYTWRTNERTNERNQSISLARQLPSLPPLNHGLGLALLNSISLSRFVSLSLGSRCTLLLLFAFGLCLMCHEIRGKAFASCNPICTILHCIAHIAHRRPVTIAKCIIIFSFLSSSHSIICIFGLWTKWKVVVVAAAATERKKCAFFWCHSNVAHTVHITPMHINGVTSNFLIYFLFQFWKWTTEEEKNLKSVIEQMTNGMDERMKKHLKFHYVQSYFSNE